MKQIGKETNNQIDNQIKNQIQECVKNKVIYDVELRVCEDIEDQLRNKMGMQMLFIAAGEMHEKKHLI